MIWLRLLGQIDLAREDASDVDALLRQPKHLALLAYLSLPVPGTWHRRDLILSTFWPEADQSRARSSLRSALYTLRSHLPEGTIKSRGDDDIGVDSSLIDTDAASMLDDFESGRFADAMNKYGGDLLPGIFIADSPAFEKWLDGERSRLNSIARKSALELSRELESRGDLPGAIDAARRGYELDPDDEAAARRWISLLDKSGDRAQSFAVYERFRNHMSEHFGVRPSAETVALMDAIRTRHQAFASESPAAVPRSDVKPRPGRRWMLAGIPLVIAVAALVALNPGRTTANRSESPPSLVILPMQNETGDPSLGYVADGVAEGIARRLDGLGGLRVQSGARSEWSARIMSDVKLIGRQMGSTTLLRTTLRKVSDSLEVVVALIDTSSTSEHAITSRRFTTSAIRDVESRIAADVAGDLFRKPLPEVPRAADQKVGAESYRLMLKGWHTLLANAGGRARAILAREQFAQAVALDPLNARAWSGLASVWAGSSMAGEVPFEQGFERASSAALHAIGLDSLQGSAWANLGGVRALKFNNLAAGLKLIERAELAEPSNPEIYLIKSQLFRAAHRFDDARDAIRIARTLDPWSAVYLNQEAAVEFCVDRPDQALRILQRETRLDPNNVVAVNGMVRSLALLGRFDEAFALWRQQARASGDTALVSALSHARGASDYWELRHAQGAKLLARLQAQGDATPWLIVLEQLAAGQLDAAQRTVDAAPVSERPVLYRLQCMPGADEYRRDPRFHSLIQKIGALKER